MPLGVLGCNREASQGVGGCSLCSVQYSWADIGDIGEPGGLEDSQVVNGAFLIDEEKMENLERLGNTVSFQVEEDSPKCNHLQ